MIAFAESFRFGAIGTYWPVGWELAQVFETEWIEVLLFSTFDSSFPARKTSSLRTLSGPFSC
jgi:hypothetical protein